MSSEALQVEEALSRAEQRASPLYAGRVEVYAKADQGPVPHHQVGRADRAARRSTISTPWLRWDRGPGAPNQAVLADMAGGRLYFFGIEIWPQEVYYLTGLLMLAAFGLFLATSLFGRLWCGFACPQTVWTDLFMQVERWIEGDRAERIRFDKAPWTPASGASASLKHAAWLLIAFLTGGAWIMYFRDAPTVVRRVLHRRGRPHASISSSSCSPPRPTCWPAWRASRSAPTCARGRASRVPWSTRTPWRSPTRPGAASRAASTARARASTGRGDCIDCKQCVAVCPMGIDIRDGFQLECIGCGLCVDACDEVMAKIGRPPEADRLRQRAQPGAPRGGQAAGLPPRPPAHDPLRGAGRGRGPHHAGRSSGLRSTVDVNILPDRNPLFVTMSDGSIRNGYTIRVMNKAARRESLRAGPRRGRGPAQPGPGEEGQARPLDAHRTAGRRGHAPRLRPAAARGGDGRARADLTLQSHGHRDRPADDASTPSSAGRSDERRHGTAQHLRAAPGSPGCSSPSSCSSCAVNGAMIWIALSSWTGLATNQPYDKGLTYNRNLEAAARQAALGWQPRLAGAADGRRRRRGRARCSRRGRRAARRCRGRWPRFERPTARAPISPWRCSRPHPASTAAGFALSRCSGAWNVHAHDPASATTCSCTTSG